MFPNFIQGTQFEEELYLTYHNSETNTNIFVSEETIRAVQNGKSFIYNGVNLISKTQLEAIQILSLPLPNEIRWDYHFEYENGLCISLYCVDDIVKWVTISDWEGKPMYDW